MATGVLLLFWLFKNFAADLKSFLMVGELQFVFESLQPASSSVNILNLQKRSPVALTQLLDNQNPDE